MISLEKCKQILNKGQKKKYTDEEVLKIRDFLNRMAEIEIEAVRMQKTRAQAQVFPHSK
jgi:hypothetical protein